MFHSGSNKEISQNNSCCVVFSLVILCRHLIFRCTSLCNLTEEVCSIVASFTYASFYVVEIQVFGVQHCPVIDDVIIFDVILVLVQHAQNDNDCNCHSNQKTDALPTSFEPHFYMKMKKKSVSIKVKRRNALIKDIDSYITRSISAVNREIITI